MNDLCRNCGTIRNKIEVNMPIKRDVRDDRQPQSIVSEQHAIERQRMEVQADAAFIAR